MEPYSLNTILIVFGGGVIGTALGGLWAIIICALIALIGCGILLCGGSDFVLAQIAFGSIFGPHVGGFAAPLVAGCYAVMRKKHPGGSAKDILTPLLHAGGDTLLVGGFAAVAAHLLLPLLAKIPVLNQTDLVALDLTIITLLARFVFLKEMPLGNAESIKKHGLFGTDNYTISWAGWQSPMSLNVPLSFGMGLLSAGLAWGLKNQLDPLAAAGKVSALGAFLAPLVIGWVVAILILTPLLVSTGKIQQVPIMHCMAIIGAWTFMHTGSILAAGVAGVIAGWVQEMVGARMFYNHGSSHIDPPATAIMVCTWLVNIIMKPEFLNMASLFK
jgi:hypothetical protein